MQVSYIVLLFSLIQNVLLLGLIKDRGYFISLNMVYSRWIYLLHDVISIDLHWIIEYSLRDRWIS